MGNSQKKVLLCNGAHIGDLILSTSVLPAIKAAYPNMQIGFLIGSWSKPVLEHHQDVDWIHIYDHPKLNRSSMALDQKKNRGDQTWHSALKEIQEKEYDVAIDLYYFYKANVGELLAESQIPIRYCFWASPSHYYFTHRLVWNHLDLHMIENHKTLFQQLGMDAQHLSSFAPSLTYTNSVPELDLPYPEKGYLVIHPGVGSREREWTLDYWKELVLKITSLGYPIVFIGKGTREKELAETLFSLCPKAINLVDKPSWRQLIPLIKKAKLLVGLESMAGHLAAAVNTPAVLIYAKSEGIKYWCPYNSCCHVVALPERNPTSHKLQWKPYPPLKDLQPDKVFEEINSQLTSQNKI